MDYLAIVKERAEGKDLSVLGGSVKFVADDTIVFIDGVNGEISSDETKQLVQLQQILKLCKQLWMDLQVHKQLS